ncbi:hypothetical protein HMPREF0322_00076 [Desulfitobacterium hafniense DP7]|uniref:Uncharacterized protein n=1 Tax=Desulfitobacterium hafniense DP7 TaxID=537010 RepID=G9XGL0_DESHA|nr:hypothetical protein [Desulfitobacterium hafniense]EHL09194.1 hypothetical protein HMPREF0322_00076 [Desulfitobacterium hafniense DP7]
MLLQGIPEQIGVIALAYAIAKLPMRGKEIILMGIFLGLIASLIRVYSIPFGTHTLALMIILFLWLTFKGKEVTISLVTTLISFVALALFEVVIVTILIKIFNTSQEIVFSDPLKRILFTEPQVIMLFVTAFIIRRKRRKLNEP